MRPTERSDWLCACWYWLIDKICELLDPKVSKWNVLYLVVNIFEVNLGLDDVHEWVHQSCALPQLPPRLTSLRTHIPLDERKDERRRNTNGEKNKVKQCGKSGDIRAEPGKRERRQQDSSTERKNIWHEVLFEGHCSHTEHFTGQQKFGCKFFQLRNILLNPPWRLNTFVDPSGLDQHKLAKLSPNNS